MLVTEVVCVASVQKHQILPADKLIFHQTKAKDNNVSIMTLSISFTTKPAAAVKHDQHGRITMTPDNCDEPQVSSFVLDSRPDARAEINVQHQQRSSAEAPAETKGESSPKVISVRRDAADV